MQACYVFPPRDLNGQAPRPSKRKKTARATGPDAHNRENPFVTLLGGAETYGCTKARMDSFEAAWRPKKALIAVICLKDQ